MHNTLIFQNLTFSIQKLQHLPDKHSSNVVAAVVVQQVDLVQSESKQINDMNLEHRVDKDDIVKKSSCDDDEDKFEDSFDTHPQEQNEKSSYSSLIKKSVLPSFVHTGLQRKAPFTEMKYWIALSLTLDGRDKITKVLQYSSRFLAWWFLSKARNSKSFGGHAERFTSFYKSLGKSRKAFRLGRSLNELQKISSLGLLGLFCWHLKQQHLEDRCKANGDDETDRTAYKEEQAKSFVASAAGSSSLGLLSSNQSGIHRRILSMIYSSLIAVFPSNDKSRVQWWKIIGSSLKTIGMFGYWLGDNANFLTSSGALDNYSVPEKVRLARRKRWLEITSKKANQFYFFATIVGLFTNSYAYYRFQSKNVNSDDKREETQTGMNSVKLDSTPRTSADMKEYEEKQFVLFLALLKSCMDIVVFSNNAGIDLHKKWRGRKNHEAIHCLCGLISAGTSLYNNFPDAKI